MSYFKKFKFCFIFVVGMLFVTMSSSLVLAADKVPMEKQYLETVYKNMLDVKNVHYDILLTAQTPMGDVNVTMAGDGQMKPMLYKNDAVFLFRDVKGKETTTTLQQYIEQNKDTVVIYSLSNNKWMKQTMPVGFSADKELTADENSKMELLMMQMVKAVKLTRETPSYKYMEVTLDSMKISDSIDEMVRENKNQDKNVLSMAAFARIGLLAAGDIKYNVKIDKTTQMIQEVAMNLANPIRKAGNLFLDMSQPKNAAEMEDFLTKSTLTMQVKYSQYNKVDPIEIPQMVRDTAKEVKTTAISPKLPKLQKTDIAVSGKE
ncbi:hypothetical protein SAMN05660742_11636 [Propionispira arboris]|uniref:DUF1002 domain-containing protein n=1 Tax=Propionispira arboris TaxID=84035 RepID=A0A1H7BFJ2_9FIRM|nr:DUF6612 family protein [Propionispira arboris]SEJ75704.1 hypothetical protein SAMN05660742_11636 [Propionispira arboris]